MITYTKRLWGLPLILRLYGSAFPRAVPAAAVSALTTALLLAFGKKQVDSWWQETFPYQMFSFLLSLFLIFRTNYGYNRYQEGATQLHYFQSKLSSAVQQFLTFDCAECNEHEDDGHDSDSSSQAGNMPPAANCTSLPRQWTYYVDYHAEYGSSRGFSMAIIHTASLLHAVALQDLRRDRVLTNLAPHSSTAESRPPMDPQNLRSDIRPKDVGHFKLLDLFMLHGDGAHVARYNAAMPLSVIGGTTRDERTLLNMSPSAARASENRAAIVGTWLLQLVQFRRLMGGLKVDAPILASPYRAFQDAMDALQQCQKLAETPFPFPWAQFVVVLLVLHTFTVPIVVIACIREIIMASLMSVLVVFASWTVNEVARDIEDPFLYEPNDLPLARLQFQFNERLLCIAAAQRPGAPFCHDVRASQNMAASAVAGFRQWFKASRSSPMPPRLNPAVVLADQLRMQAAAAAEGCTTVGGDDMA